MPLSLSTLSGPTAWADSPSPDFGADALAQSAGRLAILPLHGWGDHGLGLGQDVEEVIGGAVLSNALRALPHPGVVRVLPPWRQVLAPYPGLADLGGLDPETAHDVLHEIAAGVKQAGYERLLFFCTSPWSGEWIDAASRDVRVGLSLQTFVIELGGLDLHLHPNSPDRARAQAVAASVLGQTPCPPSPTTLPPPIDLSFRPGNWRSVPAVEPDLSLSGDTILAEAAARLAALLTEVMVRPGLNPRPEASAWIAPTSVKIPECPPFPGPRRSRYLPALNTSELTSMPSKEQALIIIPVGAIEQHGPHLPVGVDAYIGEATCAALSARLPDAPVWFGPPLPLGKSNEHLDYPGTISLSARSLRRLLLAQIEKLVALGFRQFALLNTHGGNSAVLVYTLREIQQRWGVRAGMLKVPSTNELSAQEATWGFHAGEWETSIMLHIAPHLVAMDKALCHYPATLQDPGLLRPESAPAIFSWMTRDIAPDGVMGDATAATAEKGERWFEAAMDQLAEQIRDLLKA
ncbi:creatininase family protein [Actomonas aquatica]|uniref:Creatininase family protein n=1 Tax=Actomonas aquatica TaxID=2866162 RepID=A0ABZ1C8X7_9BACT|nr:creatininase family protein [Opitutus sp. WL0086]WRQ88152.1 creatininase family protein [Opitutus sp. WL0086]